MCGRSTKFPVLTTSTAESRDDTYKVAAHDADVRLSTDMAAYVLSPAEARITAYGLLQAAEIVEGRTV